ncbi:hypothetical protein IV203_010060 [Nitzschia inconspicua]|uniref:Transmembrane protein n=1 Tax=Nitzschia inconspicua TaxID=303405 RepID=A0A9K3KWW8_9STRA|nr:hypothetical protein IV203_010060 [Nitzschia inconspicua]
MESTRDELPAIEGTSLVDKDFFTGPSGFEMGNDERRSNCYSPYVALSLALFFVVTCFSIDQPDPACSDDPEMNCDWSYYWLSLNALDFYIFGVTTLLTLHLWLVGRNKTSCLAFSFMACGFLIRGSIANHGYQKGYDLSRYQPVFYVATMLYYVCWTISAVFFRALIERAWERATIKPRFCGVFESGLALLFLGFSTVLLIVGGFLSATGASADMVFNIGRISWHISFFVFLCGGGNVWGAVSSEQTVKVWGLPNSFAGRHLIFFLSMAALSWIVVFSWKDPIGSFYFEMLAYFGLLMTVFFTHNVLLSVVIPFEIFQDDVSLMSDTDQAQNFTRNLEKPMANGCINRKEKKRGDMGDDAIPDTESSSFESLEAVEKGNYDPDFDDLRPSTDPVNLLMFFSMFRPRDPTVWTMTASSRKFSRNGEGNILTRLGLSRSMDVNKLVTVDHNETVSKGEIHEPTTGLTVNNEEEQQKIKLKKCSSVSSVTKGKSVASSTSKVHVPILPSCGFLGWSFLKNDSSHSGRSNIIPDIKNIQGMFVGSILQGDDKPQNEETSLAGENVTDISSYFYPDWFGHLFQTNEAKVDDKVEVEEALEVFSIDQNDANPSRSKHESKQGVSGPEDKNIHPVASVSFSSVQSTEEGFVAWIGALIPTSFFATVRKDEVSNSPKRSDFDDKIEDRVIRDIENGNKNETAMLQSKVEEITEIPRVLTLDRYTTPNYTASFVSHLTGPAEGLSVKNDNLLEKRQSNDAPSSKPNGAITGKGDSVSLTNYGSAVAQGKYKSMLRNNAEFALTRSAIFEETSHPLTTMRIQSEGNIAIGVSTSSTDDLKQACRKSLEEVTELENESQEITHHDFKDGKDGNYSKRRCLLKRPGFWPKRPKIPKEDFESHEIRQDFSPEKAVPATLLENLSVRVHMTETEDEEDDAGIAHLMRSQSKVDHETRERSIMMTITDEIASAASSDTDASSFSFTTHTRGLDVDLDIVESESGGNTSAGSSCDSGLTDESRDFVNQVMASMMHPDSPNDQDSESTTSSEGSVTSQSTRTESIWGDKSKQMKVRQYSIKEHNSKSSDNHTEHEEHESRISERLSVSSSTEMEGSVLLKRMHTTNVRQTETKEVLHESLSETKKKSELFLLDLSEYNGDTLDLAKVERAPSIHSKQDENTKKRGVGDFTKSVILVHLPSRSNKYENGIRASHLERAISCPSTTSQHQRQDDSEVLSISKSIDTGAKPIKMTDATQVNTEASEEAIDSGVTLNATTKKASILKSRTRSSRKLRKSSSPSGMNVINNSVHSERNSK